MHMYRRIARGLPWLVLVATNGCRRHAEESVEVPVARVHCAPIETKSWEDVRTLRGTVVPEPDRDAIVSSQVPGKLLRVLVREGDPVAPNAVLAEVESRPLRDALRQAEAVLDQAKAQGEASSLEMARQEHLVERGISARQTYEASRAAYGQSAGAIALARAQVDVARQNVERATLRSPIAGVVVHLLRRTGEVVDGTPMTPVMEIADPSSLELAASVQAGDLIVLRAGQHADVSFEALPDRVFSASVRSVAPAVDPATGVGSVRLALNAENMHLPLGMLGTAKVRASEPRSVRVVPTAAIRNVGGTKTEVVLCDGGKARPVEIEVGDRRDGYVQIAHGSGELPADAKVAVDALTGLEEGMSLEVFP